MAKKITKKDIKVGTYLVKMSPTRSLVKITCIAQDNSGDTTVYYSYAGKKGYGYLNNSRTNNYILSTFLTIANNCGYKIITNKQARMVKTLYF